MEGSSVLAVVFVASCLAFLLLAWWEGRASARSRRLREFAVTSGIHLDNEVVDRVSDSEVRFRRRVLVGTAAGALLSGVVVLVLGDRNVLSSGFPPLVPPILGAVVGAWTAIVIEAKRRWTRSGSISDARGPGLAAFVGIPTLVGCGVVFVATLGILAYSVFLMVSGIGHAEAFRSPAAPWVGIAGFALLVLTIPGTLAVGATISRNRAVQSSTGELMADDALLSRHLLLTLGTAALGMLWSFPLALNITSDLLPHAEHPDLRLTTLWSVAGIQGGLCAVIAALALFRPFQSYLRTLWPEVYADGRAAARAMRVAKRAAERRAYHGLPSE